MLPLNATEPIEFKLQLGAQPSHLPSHGLKLDVQNVSFWYGDKPALKDVALHIYEREVTAFIGPSGCGKSTLLRCLNRTNDDIPYARMTGTILLDGDNINDERFDPPLVRRRFGWVAQKPNPFATSVYHNVAYGPQLHGLIQTQAELDAVVEDCLRRASLWHEVKDRLTEDAMSLSVGQQQRLCIARAIATAPEVLLMDEPASALDPISTARIEELIDQLREAYAIVIITHNMQQAARVSQRVAMFYEGAVVESGDAEQVLIAPRHKQTQAFLRGRFG
jgi:phosphate transport system ATP-binding protein